MLLVKIQRQDDGHYAVWFQDGEVKRAFARYTPEQFLALRLAISLYGSRAELHPVPTT